MVSFFFIDKRHIYVTRWGTNSTLNFPFKKFESQALHIITREIPQQCSTRQVCYTPFASPREGGVTLRGLNLKRGKSKLGIRVSKHLFTRLIKFLVFQACITEYTMKHKYLFLYSICHTNTNNKNQNNFDIYVSKRVKL